MSNEVIILSDNSDDEVTAVINPIPTDAPNPRPVRDGQGGQNLSALPGRLVAKTQPVEIPLSIPTATDDLVDDEIEITSVTNIKSREGQNVSKPASETRTELECVGERQGIRALRDYPHFRFDCDTYQFKKVRSRQKESYCERCYCYICDVLASQCTKWSMHCKVTSTGKYHREREAVLNERRRRELNTDEGRCTMLKRIVRPQFVNDTEYEQVVELPNEEEEFEDDGCPHSGSEDDQASLPITFDHGHVIQSIQRIQIGGKGSKLERVIDVNPETKSYSTFRRGASAYEDLL
ncbi:hypothetical protein FGB62_29g06 [Gracilaria domingensis]|nr:hypothetical protein FGB62_29g06 [Gracilaria domingensis]